MNKNGRPRGGLTHVIRMMEKGQRIPMATLGKSTQQLHQIANFIRRESVHYCASWSVVTIDGVRYWERVS